MIRKNDDLLITVVERTDQRKGTVDTQNFQTQLIPCTSPVNDHATYVVVEAMVHSLEGLTRTSKVALVRLLWESQFCQLLRFCCGWSDIRVISETDLSSDQVAEHRLKS